MALTQSKIYTENIHPELPDTGNLEDVLNNIVGAVPDSGKTLEEYREERIRERYELTD